LTNSLFIWATDFRPYGGEGILSREFSTELSRFHKNINVVVVSTDRISKYKSGLLINEKILIDTKGFDQDLNQGVYNKYFAPFKGVFLLRKYRKKYKYIAYINYLPLWNIFLFLLLPKQTILGPIVGGYPGVSRSLFRRLFFPFFYMLSGKIISKRFKSISLGNPGTYVYFPTKYRDSIVTNIFGALPSINILRKHKILNQNIVKEYDVFVYYRIHSTRYPVEMENIVNELSFAGFRVCIIGDNIDNDRVFNYGFLPHEDTIRLLSKSQISIAFSQNIFSLIFFESIAVGTPPLVFSGGGHEKYKNFVNFSDLDKCFYEISSLDAKKVCDTTKYLLSSELPDIKYHSEIFFSNLNSSYSSYYSGII
jgi:hypothetical protein